MRTRLAGYDMRRAASLDDALTLMASEPGGWTPFAGGTDLMVEVNEGHRQFAWPEEESTVMSLAAVHELSTWIVDGNAATVTLGATVTWSEASDAATWTPVDAPVKHGTLS